MWRRQQTPGGSGGPTRLILRRCVGLALFSTPLRLRRAVQCCSAKGSLLLQIAWNVLCCNVRVNESTEGRFAAAATTQTGYGKPERHNMFAACWDRVVCTGCYSGVTWLTRVAWLFWLRCTAAGELYTAPKQRRGRFCVARTCCAIRSTRVGSPLLLLLLLLSPRPVYIGIPK